MVRFGPFISPFCACRNNSKLNNKMCVLDPMQIMLSGPTDRQKKRCKESESKREHPFATMDFGCQRVLCFYAQMPFLETAADFYSFMMVKGGIQERAANVPPQPADALHRLLALPCQANAPPCPELQSYSLCGVAGCFVGSSFVFVPQGCKTRKGNNCLP